MFLSALKGSCGEDLLASMWMVTTHLLIPDVCRQRRSCQKTTTKRKKNPHFVLDVSETNSAQK